ncbi:MAG: 50S ribosomal protein L1 [Planctomycetota bacterium]
MANRSKRYRQARAEVDRKERYSLGKAIDIVRSMPGADFDETVEVAIQLGIDPRQTDQQVRTSLSLPHGTGKEVRVIVFAEGDDAEAAREAGADEVGSDDLVERIEDGWMDFDVALATPKMMSKVGRLGRYLGPRGLMPTPKNGTVRDDIGDAVEEFKAGKVELRNDDGGNVHVPVGKLSFADEQLQENVQAVMEQLTRQKPPGATGRFFRNVVISSTMSPGVKLSI